MTVNEIKLVQGEKGIELPVESGNWVLLKEEGYSPVQSLVAAVGACGAYVYQSILTKSRIEYEFSYVDLSYERDADVQSEPVKKIDIIFHVKIDEKDQGRAERSLKLISPNCPVIQSLNPTIEVNETVVFL